MRTAQDILAELNAADESPRVEAKRSREVGKSIMEPNPSTSAQVQLVLLYQTDNGVSLGY